MTNSPTSEEFRILVCGGRSYMNRLKVWETLDKIHAERPITLLIHGAAKGADTLAHRWACYRKLAVVQCPAQWHLHGPAAGPMRNEYMLSEWKPNLVVSFSGGKGTEHMCRISYAAGVDVMRIPEDVMEP